jgi:hypothetical protein
MAKTTTERQRDWRARQRETMATAERLTAEHAAFKAKARTFAESQMAEIERLTAALAEAEAGRSVPPCKACGGQLACPGCSQAGGWQDDFG